MWREILSLDRQLRRPESMSLAKLSALLSALAAESGGQRAACLGWHAPSAALGTSSGAHLPAVLSVGLRKLSSVLCGQGRMVVGRCFTAGEMSAAVLPPCCPRSIVPRFVTVQDLDVTPNSKCQRKRLRTLGSVLPPEEVCPDGLLCRAFSSGHCLSARESHPVPSPPAKQGPV